MLTTKENLLLGDDAVRQLRKHVERCLSELNGNMAELSRQIGMNETAIRDFLEAVETGSPYPSIRLFLGVAHVLGYTVSELIGEEHVHQPDLMHTPPLSLAPPPRRPARSFRRR